jgi:hypothetical protein
MRPLPLTIALLLVIGLPLAGKWARHQGPPRCALDGLPVEPRYQVRLTQADGRSATFCCVRCAARWLAQGEAPPAAAHVTDEATGVEIPAREAHFVESPVATSAVTGNRVHAFRRREDAADHLRAFGGHELTGADRPLAF